MEGAYKTSVLRESFRGGNAIFTVPPFPIKCGGAPQKIMYLSEATFRKNKVRDQTTIKFFSMPPNIFPPCKDFQGPLQAMAEGKGIETHYKHTLTAIDKENRVATFVDGNGDSLTQDFDFLHFVPPQSAPEFVANSALAAENGFLDVNKETL